ncbi:hypothetical protein [Caldivirga sp.]|nr:hypothetical protein [Caldivirga sp.]
MHEHYTKLSGRIGHIYVIRRRIGHIYVKGDLSGLKGEAKSKSQ